MTLEQLRIFVAVAEREHVTQAAHDLHLTQSAVSAAITALEGRYAIKLFDRIGRRIALTDAGRTFLEEARAILMRAADGEAVLSDLAGFRRGELAIAASQTIGTYWIPRVIQAFATTHPGIRVTLELGNTEFVASRLRDGAALIGFVEGPVDEPNLAVDRLFDDELMLVTAPSDPWLATDGSMVERLRAARWVLREKGSGTRVALEQVLAHYDLLPEDVDLALELPSNEAIRTAVEAGAGITVLSRMAAGAALAAGTLVQVETPLPGRAFHALRHRERYFGRAATAFVDLVRPGPFGVTSADVQD
ncbi:LysR family transcriptional regulator [Pleomorphomonas diazotrophica]|uniref:LysR family transcriptional regulator n=1 Tax=Pleomorphomonas diazotrophica TaxID=1166257 RepID=A0A1I4U7Y6_9HYPH|nr:LysR family transcriptional regulator [Pleomorphomonas diazotrophica]PKR91227.1 LysR family transcriptional regulator [Pleomorphomonas diazotrophica]SFM85098.1 DNA-binding transcriptional regulator, LysR family [Pleomorphomonas diazotrophica]